MKNLVLLITILFSVVSFAQDVNGEKKPKLEIRSNNTDHEIHRKTNDHKSERVDLKKEDRRDHAHKPAIERHNRPHLDGKLGDRPRREEIKKERRNDKHIEQRQEKRQEKRQEILQQRKDRRENKG